HASAQRSDKPQDRARAKPRRKADHFAELWSPRPWPSRRVKRRRAECAADRRLKWSSIYDHVAPAIEGQVQLPPGMSPPGSSPHGTGDRSTGRSSLDFGDHSEIDAGRGTWLVPP